MPMVCNFECELNVLNVRVKESNRLRIIDSGSANADSQI